MLINLIAVGKRMPRWVEEGYNDYAKRLPFDYKLELIELSTSKLGGSKDVVRTMRQEGEQMLKAIPKNSVTIALDIKGEQWDTDELASYLQQWHDQNQDITLLIGGPLGLTQHCLDRSEKKWSLSKLTFPHPLVRVMVAEQLYRAFSILTHHPYHRK